MSTPPYWKDYPELTKKFRTLEEEEIGDSILNLYCFMKNHLRGHESSDLSDLVGAIHLLQSILITIQKRRYNNRRK